MPADLARAKRAAGEAAAALVEDGMVIGLGSGTTAATFLDALAGRVRNGLTVAGVPTSVETEINARRLGITLSSLEKDPVLDLDVDGADEIDPDLSALKGGGGALLHEKIVALASRRLVLIADSSKLVPMLCLRTFLPVEVVTFGWTSTRSSIQKLGASVMVRGGEQTIYLTDSGNMILDVKAPTGVDIFEFGERLKGMTGVVDHGIFRHLASTAIIGYPDGTVQRTDARTW